MNKFYISVILIISIFLSLILPYKEYFIPNRHDQLVSIYKDSPQNLKTYRQENDKDSLNSMCLPCDAECKPECCETLVKDNKHPIYSCSTGCVCLNDRQYNYLLERGGNNLSVESGAEASQMFSVPSKIKTQFALL